MGTLQERLSAAVGASVEDLVRRQRKAKKPVLRRSEARLLAMVRDMDDNQINDVIRGVKLILQVGKRS